MWIYDAESLRFLDVNEAAVDTYGYARERFLSMRITDIRPEWEQTRLMDNLVRGRAALDRSGPWLHTLADGSHMEVEVMSHVTEYGGRPAVLVTVFNVTEQNRLQRRIRDLEEVDVVTGLANRSAFIHQLSKTLVDLPHGAAVAVVMVDLDGFLAINANHGEEVGDEVLRRSARALLRMGDPGTLISRVGADRFALAVRVDHPVEGLRVADRIHAEIVDAPPSGPFVTATIAVSVAETPEATADGLLSEATAILKWAKSERRGTTASTIDMGVERSTGSIRVETLRAGIAAGQLRAHYQPVFAVGGRELIGAEALTRWETPDHGLVSPSYFIPLAETTGLISDIWRWLVDEALAYRAAWPATDRPDKSIAINLSAHQFENPSTIDDFVAALANHSVDPSAVVIEITESAVGRDPERMYEILAGFRILGASLALDDFGTGYSNLSHLNRMPFDILKIDRSFIARISIDDRQRAIVSHVVELAHSLGMTVVAEGVETSEQYETLEPLGVDLAQGFYLGRPMDASSFWELLVAT